MAQTESLRHLCIFQRCLNRVQRFSPGISLAQITSSDNKLDKFISFVINFASETSANRDYGASANCELATSKSYISIVNDITDIFSITDILYSFIDRFSEILDMDMAQHRVKIRHILYNPRDYINYTIAGSSSITEWKSWDLDLKNGPTLFMESFIKSSHCKLQDMYAQSINCGSLSLVKIMTNIFKKDKVNLLSTALCTAVSSNQVIMVQYLITSNQILCSNVLIRHYIQIANNRGYYELVDLLKSF